MCSVINKLPLFQRFLLSLFLSSGEATADGSDLLWTIPYVITQLVHGQFRAKGIRVGVNGDVLTESDLKKRDYKIGLQEGRVEVRIPVGAHDGSMKVSRT